ncbi:HDOD domain-containing protein [Methyloversatilis discipulorum]|uniref:HDOD domain-containing protein n=1 Tax=Methyloversatilis discipulorum TaxID=1119528 RepID=UPI001A45B9A1|nr:HDOD domain-containing protein [Methyloversatilis discipulorum]MBL8469883.1 HDOD domain-containing protein [Methyloversatilis discipulorum]
MRDASNATLEGWVAFMSDKPLPVLARTTRELAQLREAENTVSARTIAQVILHDPLMTLRVLAFIEAKRGRSQHTDITTIERALMMIGITPFFNHFESMPTLEEHLHDHQQALLGVMRVIARARKASGWAREWALMRHDIDVDEITVATLLHDVAEILCWVFAPKLSLKLRDLLRANPTMRTAAAQKVVFNVTSHDLQLALAKTWRLPALLVELMGGSAHPSPRVRNVQYAVNLARHSAKGWDDPALPDDFKDIEELLRISHETLLGRLGLPMDGSPPPAPPDHAAPDTD